MCPGITGTQLTPIIDPQNAHLTVFPTTAQRSAKPRRTGDQYHEYNSQLVQTYSNEHSIAEMT